MRKLTAKLAFGALLTGALAGVGCGSDDDFNGITLPPTVTTSPTVTVTGGPTLAPPVARDDNYTVTGNGQLVVNAAQGLLANDVPNGTTPAIVTGPSKGALILNNDGSFTYTPNTNLSNTTDTFTYSLTNSTARVVATVTINIGALGAFIDNSAAAGGDGSQALPFRTLTEAVAANTGRPVTFVLARGNGTYNESATLSAGQNITSLDPANPANMTGPLVLTSNNSVSKLNFNAAAAAAINATGAAGGTIEGVNVTTTGNKAVFLGNATGTWTIRNSQFENANLGALDATSTTGDLTWTIGNCTFQNCRVAVAGNVTGSAVQTLNLVGSSFQGGQLAQVLITSSSNSRFSLTMTSNIINASGSALRGLDILIQDSARLVASVKQNTVSGCTSYGMLLQGQASSVTAARFSSNSLTGNSLNQDNSFGAGNDGSSSLSLALDSNSADSYAVTNGGGAQNIVVENLSSLFSRNSGNFTLAEGLADGPCPAP